jgi:hypothetical protein
MPMNIGDMVFFDYGYGRIVSIGSHWKTSSMDWLYTVKVIDSKTSKCVKCPDPRCTEGCAICTRKLWADQMRPFTKTDTTRPRSSGRY